MLLSVVAIHQHQLARQQLGARTTLFTQIWSRNSWQLKQSASLHVSIHTYLPVDGYIHTVHLIDGYFWFSILVLQRKKSFFLSFMEEKVWEEDSDEEVGKEKKEGERAGIRGWMVYWLVGYPCLLAYLLSACKLSSSLSSVSVSSSRYFATKDRGACLYLV